MTLKNAPDLTKRPPRSPHVRLGGLVLLARMLDKGRATLAGTNGEYNYDCPMDQHVIEFLGFSATALLKQLAAGKGDGEILKWLEKNSKFKRSPAEIAAWSAFHDYRAPSDVEGREYLHEVHSTLAPKRKDIITWFDMLDLDDYVSFGGTP